MKTILHGGAAALSLAFSLGAAAVAAASEPAPKLPPMWSVHIDTPDPARAADFQAAIGKEAAAHAAIWKEAGVARPATVRLAADDFTQLWFRPRASFSDFDAPSKLPEAARKRVVAASDALHDAIHGPLLNHRNEIWYYDRDSSYWPEGRRGAPAFVRIRSEWARPAADAYGEYETKVREALVKLRSKVGLLVFDGVFGDGATKWLWCADSAAQLEELGSPERILEKAFGKEEAQKTVAAWRASLVRVADATATPRPDLDARDALSGWFTAAAEPAP